MSFSRLWSSRQVTHSPTVLDLLLPSGIDTRLKGPTAFSFSVSSERHPLALWGEQTFPSFEAALQIRPTTELHKRYTVSNVIEPCFASKI